MKGIPVDNRRGILKCKFLFQRVLTIFNAALYGGAVITTSLDYFVEHSVMLKWVWDRVCVRKSDPIGWHSWAIVGAWPLTFILGEDAWLNSFWRIFSQTDESWILMNHSCLRTRKVLQFFSCDNLVQTFIQCGKLIYKYSCCLKL